MNLKKSQINVHNRQLDEIIADTRAALADWNEPPTLFDFGEQLVEVTTSGRIRPVDVAGLVEIASLAADWVEERVDAKRGTTYLVSTKPDRDAVRAVHSRPSGLPVLAGVMPVPFVAADGTVIAKTGFHRASGLYVHLDDPRLASIIVPAVPTDKDIRGAHDVLCEPFAEFLYRSEADRTHHIATLAEPAFRHLVTGAAPGTFIEADEIDSGKGLATDIIAAVHTGKPIISRSLPTTEVEREYTIGSLLARGHVIVRFDNLKNKVDSPALEALLTQETWTARIVGNGQAPTFSNRTAWLITGNRAQLSVDLARRLIPIRICNHAPSYRFTKPFLLDWVRNNRAKLLEAILTLLVAWVRRGRPAADVCLSGSYESWSAAMGGFLQLAGFARFLDADAISAFRRSVTGQAATEWEQFFTAWARVYGTNPVDTSELIQKVQETPVAVVVQKHPAKSLGRYLTKRVGDIVADALVLRSAGRARWALQPVHGNASKRSQTSRPKSRNKTQDAVCAVCDERAPVHEAVHPYSASGGGAPLPNGTNDSWRDVAAAAVAADPTSPLAKLMMRESRRKS